MQACLRLGESAALPTVPVLSVPAPHCVHPIIGQEEEDMVKGSLLWYLHAHVWVAR